MKVLFSSVFLLILLSCTQPAVPGNQNKGNPLPDPTEPHTPSEPSTIPPSRIFYVDFEGGSDSNNGTSMDSPWKHAPGDVNASEIPLNFTLEPGDAIWFKGGVHYYGNIVMDSSGTMDNPIRLIGNKWGAEKAIINGSTPVTGWTRYNDTTFYAEIPQELKNSATAGALNLQEISSGNNQYLWTSQWPEPTDRFFYDDYHDFRSIPQEQMGLTYIDDPEVFNQADPAYWNGSSLLIWTNPNAVILRKITDYSPELNRVYFESLRETAFYPDGRNQSYAIYNSLHALDMPGEYHVSFDENRIYLYPEDASQIETSIVVSARPFGVDIASASGITIEGFRVINHSGDGLRDGLAIGTYSSTASNNENIVIRDNIISHNRHPSRGYGGIYLNNVKNVLIENNLLEDNYKQKGIFITNSNHVTIRRNRVLRPGGTGITYYTSTNSEITDNVISESLGGHANGITIYMGSHNILVAGNKMLKSNHPLTFQDSGDLYFINNLIYSTTGSGANEWGRTSRGPWSWGKVYFLNNTIINTESTDTSLALGKSRSQFTDNDGYIIEPNIYLQYNNIIDGGGVDTESERDYNLYTHLIWNQTEKYEWFLSPHESYDENLNNHFTDPFRGDFTLLSTSSAKNAGRDITPFLPVKEFPAYDFSVDIDGNPRSADGKWSLGAYE